jgi:4-hydroxybenzoyl-CoA thioesterase
MALISTYRVAVEWGDCDPARIVFYPNYFAWFDAATRALYTAANWPYERLTERFNIIGTPLAEASVRFLRPSRFGQSFDLKSRVEDWQESRFTVLHQAYRGDALLLEGREVRFFGQARPDDRERLRAIPIPAEFKEAFEK